MSRRCCCRLTCDQLMDLCGFWDLEYYNLFLGARDTELDLLYESVIPSPPTFDPCTPVWPVTNLDFINCGEHDEQETEGMILSWWFGFTTSLYLLEAEPVNNECVHLDTIDIDSVILEWNGSGWTAEVNARQVHVFTNETIRNLQAHIVLTGNPCPDNPATFDPARFYDVDVDPPQETHIEVKIGFQEDPYPF